MFFRVLPVLVTGRLPFAFFVSQIVLLIPRPFLVDVTHTAFLVKSSNCCMKVATYAIVWESIDRQVLYGSRITAAACQLHVL